MADTYGAVTLGPGSTPKQRVDQAEAALLAQYVDLGHHLVGLIGSTNTAAGGPYALYPGATVLALTANAYAGAIPLDAADYPVPAGYTLKLRLKVYAANNAVQTGVNTTVALQRITAVAGGNGLVTVTLAAAAASAVFTNPAANAEPAAQSQEINFPTAGRYLLTVAVSGTPAANSNLEVRPVLQRRALAP